MTLDDASARVLSAIADLDGATTETIERTLDPPLDDLQAVLDQLVEAEYLTEGYRGVGPNTPVYYFIAEPGPQGLDAEE